MTIIVTVIITLLIFGFLITIHELGHYTAARIFGVGITEFSIGMGPKIFSWEGKVNTFSLRLLPIGGYVNMVGEYADDGQPELEEKDVGKVAYNKKPLWQRFIVSLAGPMMNIIIALIIMCVIVLCTDKIGSRVIGGFVGADSSGGISITDKNMYYATAGSDEAYICSGDVILSVDGETVTSGMLEKYLEGKHTVVVMRKNICVTLEDVSLDSAPLAVSGALMEDDKIVAIEGKTMRVMYDVTYAVARKAIKPVDVTVIRDGKRTTVENVVFPMTSESGVLFGTFDFSIYAYSDEDRTFGLLAYESFFQSIASLDVTVSSILDMFKGRYGIEALSGPIGVGEQIGEITKSTKPVSGISMLVVLISLSLGVCNLLPLPVLDGGRILFIIIEAIRRKPLNAKIEQASMVISMVLVLMIMAFVTLKDIFSLF